MNQAVSVFAPPLVISRLETQPQAIAQVAAWHHQECARQGLASSLELRQKRLMLHLQSRAIPKTLIAMRLGALVGCVSLVNYTYSANSRAPTNTSLSPIWLSNLYVAENWRAQGIGTQLINAAKTYAYDLGMDELWLSASEYTEFYQKRGWLVERKTRLGGVVVNVMRIGL